MPVIGSAICLIEDGRLYYRGQDAIRLVRQRDAWRRSRRCCGATEAGAELPIAGRRSASGRRHHGVAG